MSATEKDTGGLISVIIPCFNYGRYLHAALESLRKQTYTVWEAIVVDDGSTDDTRNVAEKFAALDKRICCISQQQKGISAARNAGLAIAKGEFVQFLDADDLLEPRKFEIQLQYFKGHPDVELVYGSARYFSDQHPAERLLSMDGKNRAWMPNVSSQGGRVLEHLVQSNIMVVSSPLLRRRSLDRIGLFDEKLSASEDWDLWIRCALQDTVFHYLEEPDTFTRIRYHRNRYSKNSLRMYTTALELLARYEKTIQEERLCRLMRKASSEFGLQLAFENIRRRNTLIGIKQLFKFSFMWIDVKLFLNGARLLRLPGKPDAQSE